MGAAAATAAVATSSKPCLDEEKWRAWVATHTAIDKGTSSGSNAKQEGDMESAEPVERRDLSGESSDSDLDEDGWLQEKRHAGYKKLRTCFVELGKRLKC